MDTSAHGSEARYRICPLCEEEKLVFSGWRVAQCPSCGFEPTAAFLQTLHDIVALPEHREHHRPRSRGIPNPESRS